MFYLNETYYRFIYLLIKILYNILKIYFHKVDIFFIIIISILFFINIIYYFIFTEPREIFFFYIYSCFIFFFFSFFPYLITFLFDYIKTASYVKEWLIIKLFKNKIIFSYFIINLTTFFLGLPIFWEFFLSFQNDSNIFPFFFELSGLNYLFYFNSIFIFTNCLQFFLFLGLYYFYKKGFIKIILNKTYIIFLFLIFSTMVTPPELFIQISLFCILYICLEILIFIFLLYYIYVYNSN